MEVIKRFATLGITILVEPMESGQNIGYYYSCNLPLWIICNACGLRQHIRCTKGIFHLWSRYNGHFQFKHQGSYKLGHMLFFKVFEWSTILKPFFWCTHRVFPSTCTIIFLNIFGFLIGPSLMVKKTKGMNYQSWKFPLKTILRMVIFFPNTF